MSDRTDGRDQTRVGQIISAVRDWWRDSAARDRSDTAVPSQYFRTDNGTELRVVGDRTDAGPVARTITDSHEMMLGLGGPSATQEIAAATQSHVVAEMREETDTEREEPEPDYEALCQQDFDTSDDYAEAYADVANDATLSWRLAEESPIDILSDVKRQVHGYDLDRDDDEMER